MQFVVQLKLPSLLLSNIKLTPKSKFDENEWQAVRESFKATLYLALGLAKEIQHNSGGVQLDTMFVDEGFGSLDENSLEQAMDALIGLGDSNRLVGIISHIYLLKEHIESQIVVTKNRQGGRHAEIRV